MVYSFEQCNLDRRVSTDARIRFLTRVTHNLAVMCEGIMCGERFENVIACFSMTSLWNEIPTLSKADHGRFFENV